MMDPKLINPGIHSKTSKMDSEEDYLPKEDNTTTSKTNFTTIKWKSTEKEDLHSFIMEHAQPLVELSTNSLSTEEQMSFDQKIH